MDPNKIKPGQRWRYHYPEYPSPDPEHIMLVEIIAHDHGMSFKCKTLLNGSERLSRQDVWDFQDYYDNKWELLVGQEAP